MIHGGTCRFCLRLRNSGLGEEAWNTVLLATKNFVVVPSKGAMVPGWLLVIPKAHQLSIAETPAEMRAELEHVLRVAGQAVQRRFGPPTVFEHGAATPGTAWGCGIDHAHLHLLPLPFDLAVAIEGRLPRAWNARVRPTSVCSWSADRPYIALRGPAEDAWSVIHPETIERQFIRRMIAEEVGMPERYDYDQYPFHEHAVETARNLAPMAVLP